MDLSMYYDEAELEMITSIEQYEINLAKISTGQANPKMFEHIKINYYDEYIPLNQVSVITVPAPRQILIKPYEASLTKEVVSALNNANLGFTVQNEGDKIRINIPELSTQRRQELVKQTSKYTEEAKIKIRNVRQKINKSIKTDEELTEDQTHEFLNKIQTLTDEYVGKVDIISNLKIKNLTTI